MQSRPDSGVLAGMSRAQLQTLLTNAQTAYGELMMGKKGVSYSYTQGDGTRSVSYQPTSVADVQVLIKQLQRALGITTARRRPVRFRF